MPPLPPHTGPGAFIEVRFDGQLVTLSLTGEQETVCRWLRVDYPFAEPLGPRRDDVVRAWLRFLERRSPFTIDGDAIKPRPADVEVEIPADETLQYGVPAVVLRTTLHVEGTPRTFGTIWRDFAGLEDQDGSTSFPMVFRNRLRLTYAMCTPEEPEHTWRPRDRSAPRVRHNPKSVPTPSWEVPFASLAAVLLGVLAAINRPRRWLKISFGGTLAIGLFVLGIGFVDVPALWTPTPRIPPAEIRRSMFETLHRTIYDAFESDDEDVVFDQLAASVTSRHLDELFADVYESLVMRDEAGSFSRVEEYRVVRSVTPDTIPTELEVDTKRPAFAVEWAWQIRGLVTHWGHEHRRLNEYHALYAVVHDGVSWKIDDFVVTRSARLDR